MDFNAVAGALGAEVSGIDLRAKLSKEQTAKLQQGFLDHHVLFFRDQQLTPSQQVSFTRVFGEPDIYPFIAGMPDTPEVIEIIKEESDTVNFGGSWHSDTSYLPEPALGTVLYALDVPDAGGDTQFANTAAAYDALSDGMRAMLSGLVGVNSSENGYGGSRARAMGRLGAMKTAYNDDSQSYESEHPIVRTHPQTGRKSLYIGRGHTARFKAMTAEESKPLIDFLTKHIAEPEFTCRFRWAPGSIAVWDNRSTQHYALNDYTGKRRHMRRVTIKGDKPF
ncbi:MAG: taurine dioxygenase [Gammaproteobacteria bacterium]